MEACTVPELLNIFTKIVCDRQKYCFICLRTGQERRLVTPNYFKKFLAATNVNVHGFEYDICYICERIAWNALKLYRAAVFASSISVIIRELSKREICNNSLIFEKRYFKRVLAKTGANSELSPRIIDEDLRSVRRHYNLKQTDTLIIDNNQVYEASPLPSLVAKPKLKSDGLPDLANTREGTPPSILPEQGLEVDRPNKETEALVIIDDEDDLVTPPQPKKPEGNDAPPDPNINTSLIVTTDPPNLVTFEELIQQSHNDVNFLLHPVFLMENGELTAPSLSAVIVNGNIIYYDSINKSTTPQPLGVNTDNIKQNLKLKNQVFIQKNANFVLNKELMIVNTTSISQNGPVNLQSLNPNVNSQTGNLNVDSLNPNVNRQFIDLNANCQTVNSNVNSKNVNPIMVQQNLNTNTSLLQVYSQNVNQNMNCQNLNQNLNSNVNSQNLNTAVPQKKMKVAENTKGAISVRGRGQLLKNVSISDISSEVAGTRAVPAVTDWEDKIPMDVISFMDAVDPNADAMLKTQAPNTTNMQVGNVRSLAMECDVIDLC